MPIRKVKGCGRVGSRLHRLDEETLIAGECGNPLFNSLSSFPPSPPALMRRHPIAPFLKIEYFSVLRNSDPNSTFMSQQVQLKADIDRRLPDNCCDDSDRLRHPPRLPLGSRIVATL